MWGDAVENAGSEESLGNLNKLTYSPCGNSSFALPAAGLSASLGQQLWSKTAKLFFLFWVPLELKSVLSFETSFQTGDDQYRQNKRPLFLQHI